MGFFDCYITPFILSALRPGSGCTDEGSCHEPELAPSTVSAWVSLAANAQHQLNLTFEHHPELVFLLFLKAGDQSLVFNV